MVGMRSALTIALPLLVLSLYVSTNSRSELLKNILNFDKIGASDGGKGGGGSGGGGGGGGSSSSSSSSASLLGEVSSEESDVVVTDGESAIPFSFARAGYDVLPYFDQSGIYTYIKYSFLDGYDTIIEPYAEMELVVLDVDPDSSSIYRFSICPDATDEGETQNCQVGEYNPKASDKSTTINLECDAFDTYSISLSEVDTTNTVSRSGTGKGICMSVRREMRSLTTDDLDATMDAMYTLWELSDEEGQALYGSNYHSSSYFSAAHDFNAAQQDADHIHEGLGFLTQHIKLSNMYEASIQAVNPSISLPYWDFTIDVALNETIFDSVMFTAKTFGSITKPTDTYWGFTYTHDSIDNAYIQDGRWAKIEAEPSTMYPDIGNGFSYMRGPWNMNPSPYVTRFSAYSPSLPTCSDYYGGLGMPDFMDFLETAPYGSHASTHGVIGAVFGCDKMDPLLAAGIIKDADSQLAICKKWGFYLKELYRANYISPNTGCTATSMAEEDISCGFTCNADYYSGMVAELKTVISSSYVNDLSTEDWETWRDFICTGDGYKIFVGDHLESASPSDPSFWPIHPTQERLLQLKYMMGAFSSYEWPTDAVNDYVCDKPKCYDADYGAKDYYTSCCYGHYENDQLLDFEAGDKTVGFGPTNAEILAGTNPTLSDYSMTYVYDDFDWSHCEEDFPSYIESMYDQYHSTSVVNTPSVSLTHAPSPVADSKTYKPTYSKTIKPTVDANKDITPTHLPTLAPSTAAANTPTHLPTTKPSDKGTTPTHLPTFEPTTQHTSKPSSSSPSNTPTKKPHKLTSSPTETPTNASPTPRPSSKVVSTNEPTFEPSAHSKPTLLPTTATVKDVPTHLPTPSPITKKSDSEVHFSDTESSDSSVSSKPTTTALPKRGSSSNKKSKSKGKVRR